ncbi:MAG: carbohydrate ABC transporter permease [Nitrospinota bacterium]|nr:MAG: carbohydrate ABC transporter permease [Nitrospinota bacterium]
MERFSIRTFSWTRGCAYLLVMGGALVMLFPFLWMGLTSLKTAPEIQRVPLEFLPDRLTNLDNYREVFHRLPFGRFLANSFFISITCTLTSLLLSSLAGYGFAKFDFPGKNLLFFAIISLLMVPFQSIVIPLYLWVQKLGLVDTYPGIMAPLLVSAFGVFLMREAIEALPDEYLDAARIDGCSNFRIFWQIVLPMSKPALATLAIIKFLWTWNEFFWPLVVTNSPSKNVVTLGLSTFTNMYFREYELLTAAAVLSILPILLLFICLQKWVVQAMVMSGLK